MERFKGVKQWISNRLRPGYIDISEGNRSLWRQSLKKARGIDRKYNASELLGLAEGSERIFFVDCCLARGAALAEIAEKERNQVEEEARSVIEGKASLIKRRHELELQPARSIHYEMSLVAFNATGEYFFDLNYMNGQMEEHFCSRERELKAAKRKLLGSVVTVAHLVYVVAAGGTDEREKAQSVERICRGARDGLDIKRAAIFMFLKSPSLYGDALPGHRPHSFNNGVIEPPTYLRI